MTKKEISSKAKVKLPLTKVTFDKFLVLILLPLVLPLGFIIAILIMFESILTKSNLSFLHRETRVSAGRPFTLYKFRILKSASLENEISAGANPKQLENMPGNLSAIGKILKKFGLDELPQFWNVLKGDMSFVGPRPKPVPEYEALLARGYDYRRYLRAGLTGPAQIMKGTKRTAAQEYVADQEYLRRCQELPAGQLLFIDIGILSKTLGVMLKGSGE